jgi:hypothetical protein
MQTSEFDLEILRISYCCQKLMQSSFLQCQGNNDRQMIDKCINSNVSSMSSVIQLVTKITIE